MSAPKSKEEKMIPKLKDAQAKGRPERREPSVKEETKQVFKSQPKAPGESRMGGVHKIGGERVGEEHSGHMGHQGLSHARKQLEKETERKEHVAHVDGQAMHEHSGRHGHR